MKLDDVCRAVGSFILAASSFIYPGTQEKEAVIQMRMGKTRKIMLERSVNQIAVESGGINAVALTVNLCHCGEVQGSACGGRHNDRTPFEL